jgi:hypothetical protein
LPNIVEIGEKVGVWIVGQVEKRSRCQVSHGRISRGDGGQVMKSVSDSRACVKLEVPAEAQIGSYSTALLQSIGHLWLHNRILQTSTRLFPSLS